MEENIHQTLEDLVVSVAEAVVETTVEILVEQEELEEE